MAALLSNRKVQKNLKSQKKKTYLDLLREKYRDVVVTDEDREHLVHAHTECGTELNDHRKERDNTFNATATVVGLFLGTLLVQAGVGFTPIFTIASIVIVVYVQRMYTKWSRSNKKIHEKAILRLFNEEVRGLNFGIEHMAQESPSTNVKGEAKIDLVCILAMIIFISLICWVPNLDAYNLYMNLACGFVIALDIIVAIIAYVSIWHERHREDDDSDTSNTDNDAVETNKAH